MLTATKNNIKTKVTHLLADTVTPVSIYLKVRDHFNNPVLLESNDFRSRENCYSIIGLEPIAGLKVQQGAITRLLQMVLLKQKQL